MFFISELKSRGRSALRKNYGMLVLVALLFAFINGSLVTSSSNPGTKKGVESFGSSEIEYEELVDTTAQEAFLKRSLTAPDPVGYIIDFADMFLGIFAFVITFVLILNIFLFNPLKVSCTRFFLQNAEGYPTLKELGYAFRNHYFNIVKVMLLRDITLLLWSLLLIIPGIIKSYSYRMVPYLLAENSNLSFFEALETSIDLMKGYKITGLFLDLSFIGWIFLANLTFGLSGVLYSNPYFFVTNTEFYLELKKLTYPDKYSYIH